MAIFQVTCQYRIEKGACIPIRVHTVVISLQHSEEIEQEQLRKELMEKVVKVVIPAKYLDAKTVYHIQPSGRFVIGGPQVCGDIKHACYHIELLTIIMNRSKVYIHIWKIQSHLAPIPGTMVGEDFRFMSI